MLPQSCGRALFGGLVQSLTGPLIGDPLEIAVLKAVGWTVLPGGVCRPDAGVKHAPGVVVTVAKRWVFDASLRRMTTAVVAQSDDSARRGVKLLCKGAPEVRALSSAKSCVLDGRMDCKLNCTLA
jgi:magnesium-transporting ATPase (P-type)